MVRMYQTKALLEWKERVANWIRIYGREQPSVNSGCNLTMVTVVKKCAKCGKAKDKMQRHHIGSEMAFAKIMPEYYARRYVSFLPEDVVWLCSRHHKNVHVLYQPLMKPVYEYARVCQIENRIPNPHHLELLRQQIRKAFEIWIGRKPYKKRKKKDARPTRKQSRNHSNRRSR